MNKLQMAHEYALKMLENLNPMQMKKPTRDGIMYECFELADAMQAEADKRKSKPELPSLQQTFIDGVEQPRYTPGSEEWQPDWSQAPDDACCWFIGGASWDIKPYWSKYIPCYKSETTQTTWQGNGMTEASSFGYQGNWQESLRKRPQ